MKQGWRDEVLDFWFGELGPADWYSGKTELDGSIRQRFADLPGQLAASPPDAARNEPLTALAAIVVLDQFPRNIFRGQGEAFVFDDQAIALARAATDAELDQELTPDQKQFLYMPFMHSEVLADQERGVALFRSLGNQEALDYAIEHRDIIARFGRFPHRNKALGRTSTDDELQFMTAHKGFGQ